MFIAAPYLDIISVYGERKRIKVRDVIKISEYGERQGIGKRGERVFVCRISVPDGNVYDKRPYFRVGRHDPHPDWFPSEGTDARVGVRLTMPLDRFVERFIFDRSKTIKRKKKLKNYERFSDRLKKCIGNGTLFRENCYWCSHEISMCKKYGGQCNSDKCREERIGIN